MKHIPILFSTEMVKAILDGRKTMTRRVIKPQPQVYDDLFISGCTGWPKDGDFAVKKTIGTNPVRYEVVQMLKNKHRIGDVLWVRESWQEAKSYVNGVYNNYAFKADGNGFGDAEIVKWKPSIHMPKSACRIFLQVTNVRVERLQEISEEDAIAEGLLPINGARWKELDAPDSCYRPHMAKDSFEALWQSINGPESWDANPWVWVIEFNRIDKPENFLQ